VHLGHAPCHPPGSGPLQAATAPRWDWLGLAATRWGSLGLPGTGGCGRCCLGRAKCQADRTRRLRVFWTWDSVHALEPSVLAQLGPFPFLPGALSHAMPSLAAPTPLRATSPARAPGSGIVSDSPPSRRAAAQSASNPPTSSPIQTQSIPSSQPATILCDATRDQVPMSPCLAHSPFHLRPIRLSLPPTAGGGMRHVGCFGPFDVIPHLGIRCDSRCLALCSVEDAKSAGEIYTTPPHYSGTCNSAATSQARE
jgi:hypothetical protein